MLIAASFQLFGSYRGVEALEGVWWRRRKKDFMQSVLGMWGSSHCWGDGAELVMLARNFPKGLLRSCLSAP